MEEKETIRDSYQEWERAMATRLGFVKGSLLALPLAVRAWLLYDATRSPLLGVFVCVVAAIAFVLPAVTPESIVGFLQRLMTPRTAVNYFRLSMFMIIFPMVNEFLVVLPITNEFFYYWVLIPLGSALFGGIGIIALIGVPAADLLR